MLIDPLRSYLKSQALYVVSAVLLFLVAMSLPPFSLFEDRAASMLELHLFLELFAVIVAVLIVVVSWHDLKFQHKPESGVLITGFAVVAFVDLIHALTYDGMPKLVTEASTPRAIFFWLVGRTAVLLTLIPLLLRLDLRLSRYVWALLAVVISAGLFGLGTWGLAWLPQTFVPGQGVTDFKRYVEYVLCAGYALMGLGFVLFSQGSERQRRYVFASACFIMSMGEMVFSNYKAPSDFLNIFGHSFKIIAYALLYQNVFVTAIRQPYQKLQESVERFRTLTTLSVDAYWEQDRDFRFTQISHDVGGWGVHAMLGRARWELPVHGLATEQWEAHRQKLERHEPYRDFVYQVLSPEGRVRTIVSNGHPRFDEHGEFTGYFGVSTDVSDQLEAKKHIEFLDYHDPLTGLPNQRLLQERYAQLCGSSAPHATRAALLQMDLDHFKNVNDSLGHQVGDSLLREIARRITAAVRDVDVVCRPGGDEFIVFMPNLLHADDVAHMVAALLESLQQPLLIHGHELAISASMGVAVFPEDGCDFETLRKKAEVAMYQAKQAGRHTYCFFDSAMNHEASEHLALRNGLHRALERGELVLHYQPQIDLHRGRVIGVEALLRWQHPERGLISPARFIPVAEDSGLIVPIGNWVLQEACRQAAAWDREGLPAITMAVNLSAVQFMQGRVEQAVQSALKESGLPPRSLELELTESILIQNTEQVLATLRRIKQLGVQLSIDDFGTGYSSLAYLKRFDIDKLKIDQSFVCDLVADPDDATIVRAVIEMAHSLALKTIAEGVETAQIADALKAYGCDEAQGFYYARPMPADELTTFLRRHFGVAVALQ